MNSQSVQQVVDHLRSRGILVTMLNFDEALYNALREFQQGTIATNSTSVGALSQELAALYDKIRLAASPVTLVNADEIAEALTDKSSMTVPQAVELMRNEAFADRHRAIGIDITIHNSNIEIQFNVYDGREHYYGADLAGAVNSCLVSNNVFSGTQEEVDRVIAEAMAYQE